MKFQAKKMLLSLGETILCGTEPQALLFLYGIRDPSESLVWTRNASTSGRSAEGALTFIKRKGLSVPVWKIIMYLACHV